MSPGLRKTLVIAAVVFALAAPALQSLFGFGLSASEFARQGDGTLRASGWAFSIWGVIYAGLVAFAAWQALPRNDGSPLLADVALPAAAAIAGCGAWILASAFDARWLSVVIIVGSAAVLIVALVRARSAGHAPSMGDRAFVWWPLGLLAGWLTVASALNVVTVMTAEGLLSAAPKAAAFVGIVAMLVVALFILRATRLAPYGIPVAWGLFAVWAAEAATKGDVASLALGSAILVGCYAAWQALPITERRRAPRMTP